MPDYTLYCAPDTYAMGAHAVLEEAGADYAVHWVHLFSDNPDPDFLAASPHCRTPALKGPDGTVFETGAVALYVAEGHPKAGLVIPPGDPRRGTFLQWFHYLASTLQPDVIIQYHPEFYHSEPDRQAALKAASMQRLKGVYQTLERALEGGPFFFGSQPTVPDYILALQTVWDVIFPEGDITAYPNISRHRAAICARPAVQRIRAAHEAEYTRRRQAPASK
ncbi:glutathione S-transferase family protein [Defluviimonas sp. D31]|uniref:glutathione S-transferase family protein n=1 Tax=Defluviimonas sp. D31 TaxID=3083253 RepID=UPI00296E7BA4|nr:glutathione S-transferase family protein [Defluviimonas sp. D31]MDW4551226.1 glutathione S-transferase family protein [Defluviimonas sp. D31]